MSANLIDEAVLLPVPDRLALIEAVWNSLVDANVETPPPEWHLRILEERLADLAQNPEEGVPWEEVRAEIESRR